MIRPLTLTALLLTTPAHALSCLPLDAVRLYNQAAESDDFFVIVTGRLHPDGPIAMPETDHNTTESTEATTRVRMTGDILGETRFGQPFDRDIDVTVTCLSIWCGSPVIDQDILAALRLTATGPVLEVGPCGGMAMPLKAADIEGLLECHQAGGCASR